MEKRSQENHHLARHLFSALEDFQPMCTAVLEGSWPGEIWVDGAEEPKAAMLVTYLPAGGPAWCFLAGETHLEPFNRALNQLLFGTMGDFKAVSAFLFTCSPADWGGNLGVIGDPRQPVPMLRHHFRCTEPNPALTSQRPNGFQILPMTVDLLQEPGLQLPPQVKATLGKWRNMDPDRFQDYGFLAVHQNQAVAWATVDFVAAGAGDLGFETLPEFRKRGLGSAVAAAALGHGLERGIEVHWTCSADNIGSQKTAQKLGLQHDRDYTMYLFSRDLAEHLAQMAYSYLAQGAYRKAIESYESLFAQKAQVPIWAYFDTAQAWAALDEPEKAIGYLRMAAKEGWSAVEMTEQLPEFQGLHDLPQWQEVIQAIRQNQAKRSQQ